MVSTKVTATDPQNVPASYDSPSPETEEGLNQGWRIGSMLHNYAIQTGDCSHAFKYVTEDTEEYGSSTNILKYLQKWRMGCRFLDSYQSESALFYDESKKIYRMKVRRIWVN